jgi:tagatose 6-phosphate kinase
MKKILTVTLNPVLDRRYELSRVERGSPNRVAGAVCSAGGKGVNAAKVLKQLGAKEVLATGVCGGLTGAYVVSELQKAGVQTEFLEVSGVTRSGVNIFERETGVQTEFLEPGGAITEGEAAAFLRLFERLLGGAESVIIAGSCTPGFSADIYARLTRLAKAKNAKVFLDAEGELLKNGIAELPYFVKPNEREVSALCGGGAFDFEKALRAAKEYVSRGVKYFLLSLGAEGAVMVTEGGVLKAVPEKISALNTAGSGDAATAGFAFADAAGLSDREKLLLFSRCGASNALEKETGKVDAEALSKIKVEFLFM